MGKFLKTILTFFKNNYFIIFIVFLSLLLRLVRIEGLFHFMYDEEVPAYVGRRIILFHHIPLIGGVTPLGLHLAPYFYWFSAFLLLIGKLNPVVWGYFAAVFSCFTVFLIYLTGQKLFNKKVAVISSIIWAFSVLAIIYDRHYWALFWGPAISLIVIYSLLRIIEGSQKYKYILAVTLAFAINVDPSNIIFIILSIVAWTIYKIPLNRSSFFAFAILIFSFLPLVLFDLRHGFVNTKPILKYFQEKKSHPSLSVKSFSQNTKIFPLTLTRIVYPFGIDEVAKQYSYCKTYTQEKLSSVPIVAIVFSSFVLISFFVYALKNSQNAALLLPTLLLFLYFIAIQIYGTLLNSDIFEHYITGLFPALVLILAKFLSALPKKLWLFLLAIFIIINVGTASKFKNSIGFQQKMEAVKYTQEQLGNNPFSLESLSTCWKYSGYRYLFAVKGPEPVKSFMDPNIAYLYGNTPIWEKHPNTVVSFVVHDFAPETESFYKKYILYKSHEVKSTLFGNIEVIIMDNRSNWFK